MIEKATKIRNKAGIHCRPASLILMTAQEYSTHKFLINTSKGESDLRSILSLISLGLERGDAVKIRVEGPNEAEACEKIISLFEKEFDFPQT